MTILDNHARIVRETVEEHKSALEHDPGAVKAKLTAMRKQHYRSFALYIIGCLATQDAFIFSPKQESWDDVATAVRIIAACLEQLPDPGNCPELPFDW